MSASSYSPARGCGNDGKEWFAVPTIVANNENLPWRPRDLEPGRIDYEERITIWRADSVQAATALPARRVRALRALPTSASLIQPHCPICCKAGSAQKKEPNEPGHQPRNEQHQGKRSSAVLQYEADSDQGESKDKAGNERQTVLSLLGKGGFFGQLPLHAVHPFSRDNRGRHSRRTSDIRLSMFSLVPRRGASIGTTNHD